MWDIVAGALRRWSILLTAFVLMIGGIWFGGMLYAPDDGTFQNQQVAQSTAPQPKQVAQQNIPSPKPSSDITQARVVQTLVPSSVRWKNQMMLLQNQLTKLLMLKPMRTAANLQS